MTARPGKNLAKAAAALAVCLVLVGGFAVFALRPELQDMVRPEAVREAVGELGSWGPVALIAGMAAAIIFSPIPSAPITLAAGALYGHIWGTVYALAGAELGALVAFWIARVLGSETVSRMLPASIRDDSRWGGRSEWMIAGGVFVARLFPFISFDAVSYLAGLTQLRASLFAAVTLVGMLPMTFLFAHFGVAMTTSGEAIGFLNLLAVLGLAGLLWYGWRMRRRTAEGQDN